MKWRAEAALFLAILALSVGFVFLWRLSRGS